MDVVRLAVVCGPTAAGKSALALELAQTAEATIVSADSRQVYRGFDVGTAKPSAAERGLVPHEGIDIADPRERFSAALWGEGAARWISEARAGGRAPLIVGGTGFYLRTLVAPLFEEPALPAEGRAALERYLQTLSTDELRRWVSAIDPPRAHLGRTQLLRAIEVATLTGERISDLHRKSPGRARFTARYLLVDPGPSLAGRIAARVDRMLQTGWVEEVERLRRELPADAPAWNAAGYDAIRELIDGKRSLPEARERIVIETRQYAKRQRTWFRNQLRAADVLQVDPTSHDALRRAVDWWRAERTT